jgi:uncharacterized protein (TIGR03437 family)
VTNGASFAAGSLVPGEIATAFGTSLTTGTGIHLSSSLPLPGSLCYGLNKLARFE